MNGSTLHKSRITVLAANNQLLSSMTVLRSQETETPAFVSAFNKIAFQLMVAGQSPETNELGQWLTASNQR